jgi:hypothetical protein
MNAPENLRLIKSAADMTVEEFAEELARIRHEAWFIKTSVGTRQDRRYAGQKRGDFFGKGESK